MVVQERMEKHMGYTEATHIVSGALEESRIFNSDKEFQDWLDDIRENASDDEQVFTVYHDHKLETDCECIQFETDHHPYWTTELVV
jgi:hypothetical protein